jgi:hypothetical protein
MLTVFKTGLNGDSAYSLRTEKGEMVYAKVKLVDLVRNIVDKYPELSKKIANFYRGCFADDFPEEFDISRLDPTPRADLIRDISEKYEEKVKEDISKTVKEKNTNKSL